MQDKIPKLTKDILTDGNARDWGQFQKLQNLIGSLFYWGGVAFEFLRWKSAKESEEALKGLCFSTKSSGEIACVPIYLLLISEEAGLEAIKAAPQKNTQTLTREGDPVRKPN